MMNTFFTDAFPTLNLDNDTAAKAADLVVESVTLSKDNKNLTIHLGPDAHSDPVIFHTLEKAVSEQLFDNNCTVSIRLPSVETDSSGLNELLEQNFDRIKSEIGLKSRILKELFEQVSWSTDEEDVLILSFPDSALLKGYSRKIKESIVSILDQTYHRHPTVRIKGIHIGNKENTSDRRDRIDKEIAELARNAGRVHEESRSKPEKRKTSKGRKKRKLIYGQEVRKKPVPVSELREADDLQTVNGEVISQEIVPIKNKRNIVSFVITDYTDSVKVKIFVSDQKLEAVERQTKPGSALIVCGLLQYDTFERDMVMTHVAGIVSGDSIKAGREDKAPRKRVELHCHTRMSDMDAVSDVGDLIRRAHDWGHPALAITDHGVVHAFPDALKYIDRNLDGDDPFKMIYGLEAYLVDDVRDVTRGKKSRDLNGTFVALDFETTGFSKISDRIIEIGAVRIENGVRTDEFSTYVNPDKDLPYEITKLTGITPEMLEGAPSIEEILPKFLEFVGHSMLVAHNAGFDVGFLEQACRYQGINRTFDYLDTVDLARFMLPELKGFRLNQVAKELGVKLLNHHRATDDACAAADIFIEFSRRLAEQNITTTEQLGQLIRKNGINPKSLPTYHAVLLAANETGRVNLYTLVSKSHIDYFARRPRIPKSVLNRYREGLILGSACSAGELVNAILEHEDDDKIDRIADYYDYLEIQPIGNNRYLIDDDRHPDIKNEDDLININRKIVEIADRLGKPVCATGDVHFLDPEDEIFRRIIQSGANYDDAEHQPPLYLHTTEEMLDEFSYLGEEKAYEVVVENTNLIAEKIERIEPVRPDKCPPIVPDADETLETMCRSRAAEIYGEPLPDIVRERLDKELNSIISNQYAGLYVVAQKLVSKSNQDGYLVGSRGSVGSSFVATMAGITEVNPLPAHYYCEKCRYSEFDCESEHPLHVDCGWDMPDKTCPVCGAPLKKDGFDIPFETFLGFKGNKEPDIDLNFSGDYQSKAHAYTEVLFGEGNTFRAGTISTLAEKTAFGYVMNYFEEKGEKPRHCEIERLKAGCMGIRRGTGQHPGGIVVLPRGENIHSFTPIQRPANDMKSDIITTHFEYHSIEKNLLKLDILGHDNPTMIKMLEEYVQQITGEPFNATEIPLDDPDVMSLFAGTEALGITPEQIGGCPLGCLGIPEFGTTFVIPMVEEAGPKTLSDLVKISGLSHGTDVWTNNAQDLIKAGTATLASAICTRDDIMLYLIKKEIDKETSFKIMEAVRKGKGLTGSWKTLMKEHNVPDWYLDSCEKIKYMFPKAHAAAYVMMAYRIAYCKVNYPLAYYAAYYTVRADAFSYALMCHGPEKVRYVIDDLMKRKQSKNGDRLTAKEEDLLKDLQIVREMYARGIEFLPLDIYRSKAHRFQIVDGKLLPPFDSIDGMGEKAANLAEKAALGGPFLSRADFQERSHVNSTIMNDMEKEGLFGDLPEDTQLSLFDFEQMTNGS